jgi:pimeloyl-ACP methyl ester carboxylesterase
MDASRRHVHLGLAAALAAGICLSRPAELAAQRPVEIRASGGAVVSADEYGEGRHGVVLVHGGRFDKSSWTPQARVLAGSGLRVLAIDLRAVADLRAGKESPCVYDAECLAVDVLAAIAHLRATGAEKVSLVGGSLGGGAAAQAAIEAGPGGVDRLVLLAHMSVDAPERIPGRKLFVTSRDDTSGAGPRLPEIRRQFERAPEPKELLILEGNAHAQHLFATDQGEPLLREIVRFLAAP